MDLMGLMEAMSTSDIPLIAAFFIGLMTAISPCPLATNITAIAYVSRNIEDNKHTLLVGFVYTLGRIVTYVAIAALIVWVGISSQIVSLALQDYGEKIIGPLLIIFGVLMLGVIKLPSLGAGSRFDGLKESLSEKGLLGAFLLGVIFAMAFCPFSAVLFFGMLIPLAIATGDAIVAPSVFAFATGLPVIIFSFILVYSVSKIGSIMHKVQLFELWFRRAVAVVFILVGLYYSAIIYLV